MLVFCCALLDATYLLIMLSETGNDLFIKYVHTIVKNESFPGSISSLPLILVVNSNRKKLSPERM